jgi:hypothetical protein
LKADQCIHSEHFGKGFCCRHKQVVPDQQNSVIWQANGSEKCYLYEIPSMHALTHHGCAEASHSLTLFIIENCQMAITHQYFWKFPEKVHFTSTMMMTANCTHLFLVIQTYCRPTLRFLCWGCASKMGWVCVEVVDHLARKNKTAIKVFL